MENIKKENKIERRQIIVAVVLVITIIVSLVYSICLHGKLTDTAEKLESIIAEKDILEAQLHDVESRLDTALDEIEALIEQNEQYKRYIEDDNAKWRQRYEEYSTATEAWICMKALGWSDIVCAGIMGNLMAETGGTGTLYLNWDSNGESGYGLVQWIGGRRNSIKNKYGTYPTISEQIQFIHDELYGTNGVRRQVTDRQLDAIMNAETPEDSAYAFACYYERCAHEYHSMRRGFARKAYEYFTI